MNKSEIIVEVVKSLFSFGISLYEKKQRKKKEQEQEKPVDSK